MEAYLKITAGLLLFIQAFQLASLQESTDTSGITIDKGWLRNPQRDSATTPEATVDEEETAAIDSSSGIASGYMVPYSEEEQNLIDHNSGNGTLDDPDEFYNSIHNDTTKEPEFTHATDSPTTGFTNSTQSNKTEAEEEFQNSTQTPELSTTLLVTNISTTTELQSTTVAPELTNSTEANGTTTVAQTTTTEMSEPFTSTISSTTEYPSETTEMSTVTTTTTAQTPVNASMTDKEADPGDSSERDFASDSHNNKRYVAWAAILGTAVAVISVGLVIYMVLKNRRDKGFSHRKLVEDYPSDPVHRLDNNDPLDLTFGGSAYYNPALQGDNIQMTNFPGRR